MGRKTLSLTTPNPAKKRERPPNPLQTPLQRSPSQPLPLVFIIALISKNEPGYYDSTPSFKPFTSDQRKKSVGKEIATHEWFKATGVTKEASLTTMRELIVRELNFSDLTLTPGNDLLIKKKETVMSNFFLNYPSGRQFETGVIGNKTNIVGEYFFVQSFNTLKNATGKNV